MRRLRLKQDHSMNLRKQKEENRGKWLREAGKKLLSYSTKKNYFQQDIRKYEYVVAFTKAVALLGLIAYLYYESIWAFFLLTPAIVGYMKIWEQECVQQKEREFRQQFQEAIRLMLASLNVGYSLENAIKETKKDLDILYNGQTAIQREFTYMIRQVFVQIPTEQILEEWADRVKQEDLQNFVNVFVTAKRSGGELLSIIRDSIGQIRDKIEVEREIETLIAAKKYEFKVMSAIPFGIIGYMKISFPEFMEILYGNVLGVGVMSICLMIYAGAYYFGQRIVNIEI